MAAEEQPEGRAGGEAEGKVVSQGGRGHLQGLKAAHHPHLHTFKLLLLLEFVYGSTVPKHW